MNTLRLLPLVAALLATPAFAADKDLTASVAKTYQDKLGSLFQHFHSHPELSFMEVETSKRLAQELREAGFSVTEKVGGTGVVAMLKNGPGPLVMVRADMDALPLQEKNELPYASKVVAKDHEGKTFPVMHACGHDTHITGLVGTALYMAQNKGKWSGTLMLIGQPAEERVGGALAMKKDKLYERFGKPDYAFAWHVSADVASGTLVASEDAAYSGADSVDIVVKGIGTHGASPHNGKDPIQIANLIYNGLQTIISREKAPREPGVITVGSFHAGTKHNIISDEARLQLTVRSENPQTRKQLLDAIERVAKNAGRMAGMPEDLLPTVIVGEHTPPTANDTALAKRLKAAWEKRLGPGVVASTYTRDGMGAEDFPYFTEDPYIPSVYIRVGGTPKAVIDAAKEGKATIGYNHSPLFKADAEAAIRLGVEATVTALLDLMPKK
ncbi:M20 family metallopeptidase [Massilia sp. TS11]|uniref:M20 metallopeptidase family protein n=1 Tax=Massilia sp. TS11 TaxID=2908003 RepID=UPI001EDB2E44|nr:amidohydrolase [Massilia sp. TS11]MCG2583188.1 amidohydrolase [Massilia sp. TS11]